jgi:hypothetical protein
MGSIAYLYNQIKNSRKFDTGNSVLDFLIVTYNGPMQRFSHVQRPNGAR